MRMQLDVPLIEVPNAVGLIACQDCRLEVTVKVLTNLDENDEQSTGTEAGAEADEGSALGPLGVDLCGL